MSKIEDVQKYVGLNRIYFITEKFEFINGGVFDSSYGVTPLVFDSGQTFDKKIDLFDDTVYHGRDVILLSLDHFNYELFNKKIDKGHPHDKIIVSTNPNVSIKDLYLTTSGKDILIFGEPIKKSPEGYSSPYEEVVFWEVKPTLTKQDFIRIIRDVNTVSVIQKHLIKAQENEQKANLTSFLNLSRALSTEEANITLATQFRRMVQRFQSLNDKVISLQVKFFDKYKKISDSIEEEFDINAVSSEIDESEMVGVTEQIQSDVRMLKSMQNQFSNPDESVKEFAFQLCSEICGIDFLKKKLCVENNNSHTQSLNTLAGLTKDYISKNSNVSPTEVNVRLHELLSMVETIYKNNGHNMDEAIRKIRESINNDNSHIEDLMK